METSYNLNLFRGRTRKKKGQETTESVSHASELEVENFGGHCGSVLGDDLESAAVGNDGLLKNREASDLNEWSTSKAIKIVKRETNTMSDAGDGAWR
jgi:hypothetical protein